MEPVNDFARPNEPYNDLGSALDNVYTLVFKAFGRRKLPFCVKVVNDFARPHEPYNDLGSAFLGRYLCDLLTTLPDATSPITTLGLL